MVGQGATPVVHDQSILFSETRLQADYAFIDGWAVDLSVPFRVTHTGIRYLDAAGEPRDLTMPNIHHRNETLTGLGDPWLSVRTQWAFGAWRLDARLGLSLPLGSTVEDPFRLGDMGLSHEHVQFGSGTWNPIAQLEIGRPIGWVRASAWALTQQVLYENGKGYQAGDRYALGLAGRIRGDRWSFGVGPEVHVETEERWGGSSREDEGNQGRVDVIVSTEGSYALGARVALTAGLQIPLYTHVVGGQLDMPLIGSLGVTVSFGGGDEHHEEEEAFDPVVEPVAGTVTVVDYWATWCAPCKELDALVAELAVRYPGRFVVKKIDVTTAHIHFTLPRFKIFDARGQVVVDRSGTPQELAAALEQIVK